MAKPLSQASTRWRRLQVTLLCALAPCAWAADGGVIASFELPAVTVTAPPDERPTTSVERRDPTAALTVIDVAPRRTEAVDTATALLAAPGTVIHDSGGAGQRKTLSLRGSAANGAMVLLDGIALGGPGQATDLSKLPLAIVDSIEVLRGSAAARYGPGALGGVVNLVTRPPHGASLFGSVTHGSFMQTSLNVGGSAELLGGEALVVAHGLRSEGTFTYQYDPLPSLPGNPVETRTRENNQVLQGGALMRFRRTFGARTRLDVIAEGLGDTRGLAGPVANPTATTREDSGRGVLSARLAHSFESGGDITVMASGRMESTTFHNSPFAMPPAGGAFTQLESSATAEVVLTKPLGTFNTLTALATAGGDWLREPLGKHPSWARAGAMVGDELLLFDGRLALNGSVRADVAGPFFMFSPKLGVSVVLPKGFEVKGNLGQGSRAPSFQELYVVQGTLLPNATLRPERGLGGDLGVSWTHAKGRAAVTGFATLYEDLISYEYSPPLLAKPYNFLTAGVAGVEVEGAVKPTAWLEGNASYTFLTSQNLRDDARYYLRALPFRPAHRLQARVSGGPEWLKARAEVLYQSAQFTNRTETLQVDARTFVNLALSVTPLKKPQLTVTAELKNLLDVSSQDLDGYPLPPRSVFVTVAMAWDAK